MGPRIAFCQGCSDWKAGGMYRVELYARVRRACHVEGMSTREASRVFGVDRKTVRKMLSFSVPPGYRRSAPPRRPKLGPFTESSIGSWKTIGPATASNGTLRSASSTASGTSTVSRAATPDPGRWEATGIIDRILEDDRTSHRKQRHTAKRYLRPPPGRVRFHGRLHPS